jgi:TatD DNase family protein
MLVDTHCHLYHERFDADRPAVLDRARRAGVEAIVLPAIDVPSIHAALELAHAHDDLFAMAALHPSETKSATEADWQQVEQLGRDSRIVAIGESGLDHYWDRSFDARQEDFFRRHVGLAVETGKPLILHNRDATPELLRVLRDEIGRLEDPARLRGIVHCFGGTAEQAQAVLDLGFLLGIGGTLTFKNSGVAQALAGVPLGRIVLETDAPFLAPAPHRGKRNEPAYVRHVAEHLAEVKGLPLAEVAQVTSATARSLFGLPAPSGLKSA